MVNKCWKKVSKSKDYITWKNIKNPKKSVEIEPYNKSYIIQNEKGFNAKGLISIESSKVKALARAKSYMKGNDTC